MKDKTLGEKLYNECTHNLLDDFNIDIHTMLWRSYNPDNQDINEIEVRRGLEAQKLLSADYYQQRLDSSLRKQRPSSIQQQLLSFNKPVYDREQFPMAKSMLQKVEVYVDRKPVVIDERLLADRSKQLVKRFMVISNKTRGFQRRAISGFGNRDMQKIIIKQMAEDQQRDMRFE